MPASYGVQIVRQSQLTYQLPPSRGQFFIFPPARQCASHHCCLGVIDENGSYVPPSQLMLPAPLLAVIQFCRNVTRPVEVLADVQEYAKVMQSE